MLRREDGYLLRRALDFEADGQRKKGRSKSTWKRQVKKKEKKCEDWFEKGRYNLPIKMECWHKSDSYRVDVNLATLTCWGY